MEDIQTTYGKTRKKGSTHMIAIHLLCHKRKDIHVSRSRYLFAFTQMPFLHYILCLEVLSLNFLTNISNIYLIFQTKILPIILLLQAH